MAKWREMDKCENCGAPTDSHMHTLVCCNPAMVEEPEVAVVDDYYSLRYVLKMALEQASVGKGKDRHANDKPFDRQPMMEIGRMVGPGFCLGQAIKKAQEASRMEPDAAQRELLGAINYLAGAYLLLEEIEAT
jgi:hypothetical protein